MSAASPLVQIVDDDTMFRAGIERLLKAAGYRVAVHDSGLGLLQSQNDAMPQCILLDMRMSGLGGLQVQERLNQMGSIVPVVFLTGHGDIPASVLAIKAGAEDFLTKPVSKEDLFEAVERGFARHRARQQKRDRLESLSMQMSTLTAREREVFSRVVRGKMNKQIAFELGTSERTVKAHRHAAMAKLGLQSVAAATSLAERLGMLGELRDDSAEP
jgi:FixJ family two-component response regulator